MLAPEISVVVCTRNRAASLRNALKSLIALETARAFQFEIVVVDNGSTDETAAVVASVARSSAVPISCVDEPRRGIATARNRGVEAACGDWIAFFDDDQLAERDWLLELWTTAAERRCRCVGGRVELSLPENIRRRLAPACRMLLGATPAGDRLRRYTYRFTPGAGNLLVARSVFEEVGTFDEAFNRRSEDTDFFLRMHAAGIDGWYAPRAVVHHVIPPERLSDDWFLKMARLTAEGIAANERAAWGHRLYPLVWAARVAQMLSLHVPRQWWARLRGDAEAELGARCRLGMARDYLRDGWELLRSHHSASARVRNVRAVNA
ncbi:MAG: glycosyltransferase [Planctomycetes bacterium]|nr:glycosyltransferase [Planctomycetota bacterium]